MYVPDAHVHVLQDLRNIAKQCDKKINECEVM